VSARRAADLGTVIERTLAGVWRARRAVLVWCGILILLSLASMIAGRPIMTDQIARMRDPLHPFAVGVWLPFVAIMLLMTALMLVLAIGAMRAVLDPAAGRAAYLRCGADELRVTGVMLLVAVGGYVGMLLLVVGAVLIGVLVGDAAGGGWAIGAVAAVLAVGLSLYVLVRLSLAVPLTLQRGAITLRPAWRLSKGRFWYLVGGYLLTALMTMVVMAPVFAMQMGEISASFAAGADPEADARAMVAMLDSQLARPLPWTLAIIVVTGIANGLALAIQSGMAAQLLLAIEAAAVEEADETAP